MSERISCSTRNRTMHSSMPIDQAGPTSASPPILGREPWQQSLEHGPRTTQFHFGHSTDSFMEPGGVGFFTFGDAGSALPLTTHDTTLLTPEGIDGVYLQDGFFDPSSQYGLSKGSPNNCVDFQQLMPWNYGVNTGPDRSTANVSSMTHFGTMPVASDLDDFEAAMADFGSFSLPREQRTSTSPSQTSSATGSLSINTATDLSRRSSIAYSSRPDLNNSIGRVQFDAHPIPIAAVAPPAARLPQEVKVDVVDGTKSGKLINRTRKKTRKSSTKPAKTPHASEYPAPSVPSYNLSMASAPADDEHLYSAITPNHEVSKIDFSNGGHTPQPKLDLVQPHKFVPGLQRQRNRQAATKCREKTKAAMAQLEATERAVSLEHMELSKTVTDLRGEVLALKNQLLLHGNCNCEVIQKYLRNAARTIGEAGSASYTSTPGSVATWTNPSQSGRQMSLS